MYIGEGENVVDIISYSTIFVEVKLFSQSMLLQIIGLYFETVFRYVDLT